MSFLKPIALAALVTAGGASAAVAAPVAFVAPFTAAPVRATPIQYGYAYGYGPRRYGFYGRRRFRGRLSYGTGYHGRGTATGGPVGGLPSRN